MHQVKDHFTPTIKSRPTEDLLQIVGAPKKWNPDAVLLAHYELNARAVPAIRIQSAKIRENRRERDFKDKRANEGFTVLDFIFMPRRTLFIILFSWELKKDGFDRKARQQKIIRPVIIGLIIMGYLLS